jgi:hypothetical protein
MAWTNAALVVYHGTDEHSAANIRRNGIDLTACRRIADFGRGFYVTSRRSSARYWANQKLRRLPPSLRLRAAVLTFDLNRDLVADLDDHLAFVLPGTGFFDFVLYNRSGNPNHARTGIDARSGDPISPCYDVVYGPVSGHPSPTVYVNYDQICFVNDKALAALGKPKGNPTYGSPRFFRP